MEQHEKTVEGIAARVRHFHNLKQPFRIYHGSTNSTRPQRFSRNNVVDTSSLNHVLDVDVSKGIALVEPNVPMDKLVEATLPYGLVPPVVMEFPGITVGGGFAGTGAESSSFKYGFFDQTVMRIQMVLADGSVVWASEDEKADLFHSSAGSYGTLGVTTALELQLIPARKYVELTYTPIRSLKEGIAIFQREFDAPTVDFLDGILYAQDCGVVVTGRLTDSPSSGVSIQSISGSWDPWFYLHAEKMISSDSGGRYTGSPRVDAVPLVDYLFRYDRGAFWTGYYAYKYFLTPFNRLTRWALDYFMHTRIMYHALHESGHSQRYIIQDVVLPPNRAEDFASYIHQAHEVYPLWLCPLRLFPGRTLPLHPRVSVADESAKLYVNIGVWGPGSSVPDEFVRENKKIETKIRECGGVKWLYAHAFYTKQEFWEIYDKKWYDGLRERYGATSLPNVYDKVKVDLEARKKALSGVWRIWPLSGLYGVAKCFIGGEYMIAEESKTRRLAMLVVFFGVILSLFRSYIVT